MLLTFNLIYQHFSRKIGRILAQLNNTAKFVINN